jgi:hypothetical protein
VLGCRGWPIYTRFEGGTVPVYLWLIIMQRPDHGASSLTQDCQHLVHHIDELLTGIPAPLPSLTPGCSCVNALTPSFFWSMRWFTVQRCHFRMEFVLGCLYTSTFLFLPSYAAHCFWLCYHFWFGCTGNRIGSSPGACPGTCTTVAARSTDVCIMSYMLCSYTVP